MSFIVEDMVQESSFSGSEESGQNGNCAKWGRNNIRGLFLKKASKIFDYRFYVCFRNGLHPFAPEYSKCRCLSQYLLILFRSTRNSDGERENIEIIFKRYSPSLRSMP